MPRPKKTVDLSSYVTLPSIHWKELLKDKSQAVMLKDYCPNRQMLLPGGYQYQKIVEPKDGDTGYVQYVVFDSEYIQYYFHYRFLEPIGWFVGGKVDRLGFETYLGQQYQYSESLPRQAYLDGIKHQAQQLANAYPHKTVEQWEAELLGTVSDFNPSPASNGAHSTAQSKVKK